MTRTFSQPALWSGLLGAASGVALTLLLSGSGAKQDSSWGEREATPVGREASTLDARRLRTLEQRLRALETAQSPASQGDRVAEDEPSAESPEGSAVPVAAPPPTLEERLARAARESRDPSWASAAEQRISSSLRRQGMTAQVNDIDCGTESCLVKVSWPSVAQAHEEAESLTHLSYGTHCARTIQLPESNKVPVEAVLLLECEDRRFLDAP